LRPDIIDPSVNLINKENDGGATKANNGASFGVKE